MRLRVRFSTARWMLLFASALAMFTAGCASYHSNFSKEHSAPPLAMFLQPGDRLEITFLGNPDMNSIQTIRRDGRISLQLVGDILAAGKTPGELEQELRNLYEKQLQIKEIMVLVGTPAQVFVSGEVLQPGMIEMDHPMTALDVIIKSGGFRLPEAEIRNVIVIRNEGSRRQGYSINMKPSMQGETDNPFYLKPFDIVYVPRSKITRVNDWVEQYINRMIPRTGIGFSSEGEVYFRP